MVRVQDSCLPGRKSKGPAPARWLLLLALVAASPPAAAQAQPPDPPDVLEVFVREGCPHCAAAKGFLPGFASARPGLRIVYRPVDVDASARADLIRHARSAGGWPPRPASARC